MTKEDADVWHFVCDDHEGFWTWRRLSPSGEEIAHSSYTFRSFNVCVADAELAGFVNNTSAIRRVRTSELEPHPEHMDVGNARGAAAHAFERRRRSRSHGVD
jgi:hypothetical protein